jgi:hypothetical protein
MKYTLLFLAAVILLSSCEEDFMKDHEGSFVADGVSYTADADNVTAFFASDSTLDVTIGTGQNSTFSASVRVNLNKVGQLVPILFTNNEGFVYYGSNSAVRYLAKIGYYQITEHEEGNPATQHTTGTFHYDAVNEYDSSDTVHITDGHFYVNNY